MRPWIEMALSGAAGWSALSFYQSENWDFVTELRFLWQSSLGGESSDCDLHRGTAGLVVLTDTAVESWEVWLGVLTIRILHRDLSEFR